ncbi:MAG: hypothetical protein B6U89_05675 [Desulfurococcales archaeon ex4484_58]|nr:MAG: hypothetical protein B6U89_05675 [Desulfurococcales archaeon ex4484_58]
MELELYLDNIDVIVILNVLEHLNDPLYFLNKLFYKFVKSNCKAIYIAFPEEAISKFEEKKKYLMKYASKLLKKKPYLLFHFLIAYMTNILFRYKMKNILLRDIVELIQKYGCKYKILSRTKYMTVLRIE